jgi:hypothetical protein
MAKAKRSAKPYLNAQTERSPSNFASASKVMRF